MIPGRTVPGAKKSTKKPAKKKPACRCEPSAAAKKAAAAKKTAKAASRQVPRNVKLGHSGGHGLGAVTIVGIHHLGSAAPGKHHKPTPAAKATARGAALHAGGAKAHAPATEPPKHGQAKTHCQCKKTSTPRPRQTTPRR